MRSAVFCLAFVLLCGYSIADEEPEYEGKNIEEYPSLVQVEFGVGNVWLQRCTGNVLTVRHILSAASCFSGRLYSASRRRVRAGATFRGAGGDLFPVQSAANHPSYGTSGSDGDITVVSLGAAFIFGSTIAQGSIIAQGTVIPANLRVEVAGWGTTSQENFLPNNGLYSTDLLTISKEQCIDLYEEFPFFNFTITDNMICSGTDAGTGHFLDSLDIGGPLYYDGLIIGVLSWGHTFRETSYPIVATSVASYTSWIVDAAV